MNNYRFPITSERFIAYFDIMGFRDLIYRNNHSDVKEKMDIVSGKVQNIEEYEKSYQAKAIPENPAEEAIIRTIIFSDTILMASGSNTFHDACKTIFTATHFLSQMMANHIPIKGALAFGEMTFDIDNSIYFGKPLIDAYQLSEENFFYGATLHHSYEKRLTELQISPEKNFLKRAKIPMKKGKIAHYFLSWKDLFPDNYSLESLLNRFYLSVSGSTRIYVDNTIQIYM
ncbi:MAG: hypothetical protein ABIK15_00770 [Pseudomonadota bacterium]